MIATVVRVRGDDGRTAVLKSGPRGELWRREAAGLDALRVDGGPAVPAVHAAGTDFLLLEDFPLPVPDDGPFWDDLARRLAILHSHTAPRFGFEFDNFLGTLPQRNPWTDDGWNFFAEQRLLRYLDEPLCVTTLSDDDRARLERLCGRLRDIVPAQPASLLHGDLWRMNLVGRGDGVPGVVDPAPYYAWAEVDLSMLHECGGVPARFFDAYAEVRPLAPRWVERFAVLHLRELLSMVAHFGDAHPAVLTAIRTTLRRFT